MHVDTWRRGVDGLIRVDVERARGGPDEAFTHLGPEHRNEVATAGPIPRALQLEPAPHATRRVGVVAGHFAERAKLAARRDERALEAEIVGVGATGQGDQRRDGAFVLEIDRGPLLSLESAWIVEVTRAGRRRVSVRGGVQRDLGSPQAQSQDSGRGIGVQRATGAGAAPDAGAGRCSRVAARLARERVEAGVLGRKVEGRSSLPEVFDLRGHLSVVPEQRERATGCGAEAQGGGQRRLGQQPHPAEVPGVLGHDVDEPEHGVRAIEDRSGAHHDFDVVYDLDRDTSPHAEEGAAAHLFVQRVPIE